MTLGRFGLLDDPPATFLLVGGRVIDAGAGTDETRDLGVRDGVFVDPAELEPGTERIDADGLVVAPGFCDLHAHLREPGGEAAETIASGTRAAIIGERRGLGIGSVADLVAFDPAARWRVSGSALASASSNTPLLGMELPGVVRLTVADGRVTYRADAGSAPTAR